MIRISNLATFDTKTNILRFYEIGQRFIINVSSPISIKIVYKGETPDGHKEEESSFSVSVGMWFISVHWEKPVIFNAEKGCSEEGAKEELINKLIRVA